MPCHVIVCLCPSTRLIQSSHSIRSFSLACCISQSLCRRLLTNVNVFEICIFLAIDSMESTSQTVNSIQLDEIYLVSSSRALGSTLNRIRSWKIEKMSFLGEIRHFFVIFALVSFFFWINCTPSCRAHRLLSGSMWLSAWFHSGTNPSAKHWKKPHFWGKFDSFSFFLPIHFMFSGRMTHHLVEHIELYLAPSGRPLGSTRERIL